MDSNSDVYILGDSENEHYLIQNDEMDEKKRKSIEGHNCEMVSPEEFLIHNGNHLLYSDDISLLNVKSEINENGIIIEHMDIQCPLYTLRNILQKRFNIDLSEYTFWLQDAQMLEPHKNLVDQCVQGEGLVQINVEIKIEGDSKKINIIDVLKPTDEFLECNEDKFEEKKELAAQWVIDSNFSKELERLKVPKDPKLWNKQHVKLWLVWAVRQFNLSGLKLSDWMINGSDLCKMSLDSFKKKVPKDPDDLFWTHLELLRKCKFVAIIQNQKAEEKPTIEIMPSTSGESKKVGRMQNRRKISRVLGSNSVVNEHKTGGGNRTGNNGQIQLWQFLLELLTDKYHRDVIQWVTDDGEFKLNNPEMVAQLWGQRKNKPAMTYEKLSRALRYYYDGDMISKASFIIIIIVYFLFCLLWIVKGYSASELNHLVTESAIKSGIDTTYCDYYEHVLQ
ncbi:conserved hypothetical protein [Pediculus humanus corporis]|uniref:DNA-binding protein Ets97D n=1 Tax=Pediculus humanus subsp. corporis TaxID=121224 RepID=E0VPY1_PEDHC|nr:uncharacterized protein Phum_PHUM368570 [Pediculus humanus corporis]EEB15437.1 conserved hypothetical protein [Pediculus humanus corporis]